MIAPRKYVVGLVFLLICILILRSSFSSDAETQAQSPSTAATADEKSHVETETETETSFSNQHDKTLPQQPVGDISHLPLRERLRYQFPYDLTSKFPAYIWQTWKYTPSEGRFSDYLRPSEASWSELHPNFVHEVITDNVAFHLIRYLYASAPEVVEAYKALPMPVMKADFFRYLILFARGGIYSDIDTFALKPAIDWLPTDFDRSTIGLVVGIEADPDRPDWSDWYSRRVQFCQWTIQAKPGHPVLRDIVATITEDTLRMKKARVLTAKKMDKSIVEFTGPAVWTDTVFRYFNDPDYFDIQPNGKNISYLDFTGMTTRRKVGDVVVLPITSFSPGIGHMGAEGPDDPMAFVQHEFEGTWKDK